MLYKYIFIYKKKLLKFVFSFYNIMLVFLLTVLKHF